MSAMSRRTREQDELAEQLAAILREANERLRLWGRCSDTNCQRERICCGDADQCGTRVAPESWAWLRHVVQEMLAGASQIPRSRPQTARGWAIGRAGPCAGRFRAGTRSSSLSSTTAPGCAPIRCRSARRSSSHSSRWPPRGGCAMRCLPRGAPMRKLSRRGTRRCVEKGCLTSE